MKIPVFVYFFGFISFGLSEQIERKLLCESCLAAAKEIETALKDAPISGRMVVIKKLIRGYVCNKLAEDKRPSCMQLLGMFRDEFSQALAGKVSDPKQLGVVLCYEQSKACVGVKLHSFKEHPNLNLERDIDDLLRDNKEKVRFVKPIHSTGMRKEEL
ncbi:unnamed protein product [Knipowitschia caucasica]|uniref:Saposin B-type domain-containing protein n=1 Tax=Knipowitschia caucasica TaxID=637954 RepID=A0AAV2KIF2_KNICA